jgi:hypothetical protein
MTSRTTARFREALAQLSEHVQRQARDAYRLFFQNPNHPSLRFKPVHATRPIYATRVSRDYRAVGIVDGETIVWFWIGSHAKYERLLTRL